MALSPGVAEMPATSGYILLPYFISFFPHYPMAEICLSYVNSRNNKDIMLDRKLHNINFHVTFSIVHDKYNLVLYRRTTLLIMLVSAVSIHCSPSHWDECIWYRKLFFMKAGFLHYLRIINIGGLSPHNIN